MDEERSRADSESTTRKLDGFPLRLVETPPPAVAPLRESPDCVAGTREHEPGDDESLINYAILSVYELF